MLNAANVYEQLAAAERRPAHHPPATQILQDALDQARQAGWEEGMRDGLEQAALKDGTDVD